MNLQEKVGQIFCVGFEGLTAPEHILTWLREGKVGSIILFARNIGTPEQTAALCGSLHAAAKYPILIAIDQEGGTVARMRTRYSESPGAMALSCAGADGPAYAERASMILAQEMKALGINWDFAPSVDVCYNRGNPTVGTRSFGSDPARVAEMSAAAVRGFQAGGVAACAKHFPGLGDTAVDTHKALPALDRSVELLLREDLPPYRAAIEAGLASVMTTHTIFTRLDPELPATLSPTVMQRLLRQELDYDGLVVSDCMEMKAIADHYPPPVASVLGVLAGLDVVLISHTRWMQESGYNGLLQAVEDGRVTEAMLDASIARQNVVKAKYPGAPGDLSIIRKPESLLAMQAAASAGLVLLQGELPVDFTKQVAVIEFASALDSEVVEARGVAGLAAVMHDSVGGRSMSVVTGDDSRMDEALALAGACDTLILATRNAHLFAEQRAQAQRLVNAANSTVHVALRNPFDADILQGTSVILASCSDAEPSLHAVAAALHGEVVPLGRLVVPMA